MIKSAILAHLQSDSSLHKIESIQGAGQSFAFRAYDNIFARDLFIKVYWFDENYRDSLLFEPRVLADIFQQKSSSRKHIAAVYDASFVDIQSEKYIVLKMEYCGDATILDEITEYGLPIHSAIEYTKEILEGLHFLHSSNIYHRDIKPQNIIASDEGCKIIDFGSTIKVSESGISARVHSIKTLYYAPPESLSSDKEWHSSSDLYQIGMVLYEMLCGSMMISNLPIKRGVVSNIEKEFNVLKKDFGEFENSKLDEFNLKKHIEDGTYIQHVFSVPSYVPRKLHTILKKMTNPTASKRYQSCGDLRTAISQILIPNWMQLAEDDYAVENWRGKDFRLYKETFARKESEWRVEAARSGNQAFRRAANISSFEDGITYINGL